MCLRELGERLLAFVVFLCVCVAFGYSFDCAYRQEDDVWTGLSLCALLSSVIDQLGAIIISIVRQIYICYGFIVYWE